jgi:predicted ATPase
MVSSNNRCHSWRRASFTEAIGTIDHALAGSDPSGRHSHLPELLRIKGESLLQQAGYQSISAVEDCFDKALDVGRQQDALFWQLRIALSVARLKASQNQLDDARQILVPVYDRFTEGYETADLRSAGEMLESLPPRRAVQTAG